MKYCQKCNKKYDDTVDVCPQCGGKLVIVAQKKVVKKIVKPIISQKPQPQKSGTEISKLSEEEKKRKWLEMQRHIQIELLDLKSEISGNTETFTWDEKTETKKPLIQPEEAQEIDRDLLKPELIQPKIESPELEDSIQKTSTEDKVTVETGVEMLTSKEEVTTEHEAMGIEDDWLETYRKKMEEYLANGYIVKRLEEAIATGNKNFIEEEFKRFEIDVTKLEETKGQLKELEGKGFDNDIQEIKILLTDPDKLLTARKKILELRTKISKRFAEGITPKVTTPTRVEAGTSVAGMVESLPTTEGDLNPQVIKSKIPGLKNQGYVTDILELCINEGDDLALIEEYTEFMENLKELNVIMKSLQSLNTKGFEKEIETIQRYANNPYALTKVKSMVQKIMLGMEMRAYYSSIEDMGIDEIKSKVISWRSEGYNVDPLIRAISSGDINTIKEMYKDYAAKIDKLESLSDSYLLLDTSKYKNLAIKIENIIHDPSQIDKLEKLIDELKEKIINDRDMMLNAVIEQMKKRIGHWLEVGYSIEKLHNKFKNFNRSVIKWRLGGKDIQRLEKLIDEDLKDIWNEFNVIRERINKLEAIRADVMRLKIQTKGAEELKNSLLAILKDPNRLEEAEKMHKELSKIAITEEEAVVKGEITPPAVPIETGGKPTTLETKTTPQSTQSTTKIEEEKIEKEVEVEVSDEEKDLAQKLEAMSDINAIFNEGHSLYKQKKYKEALMYYKRILEIDPKNAKANFFKKKCLAFLKEQKMKEEKKRQLPFEPNPNCPTCHGTGLCSSCKGKGVCEWCEGTGKCATCRGTGKDENGKECPDCKGTGECFWCHGTGKCYYCGGTGYCDMCSGKKASYLTDLGAILSETDEIDIGVVEEEVEEKDEESTMPVAPEDRSSSVEETTGTQEQTKQEQPIIQKPFIKKKKIKKKKKLKRV